MELLPLAVALAVCEACEAVAPVSCAIKWPNDVWIEERKVAGILIEARPREGWAVLGIGLNVDTPVDELAPELRETATSLRIATGDPVERDAALEALFDRLAAWIDALGHPERRDERLPQARRALRARDRLDPRLATDVGCGTRDRRRGQPRRLHRRLGAEVRLDAGEVHLEPSRPSS